jgi:hypothetical protein
MAAHILAADIPNSIYLLAGTPEVLQPQAVAGADNSHVATAHSSGPAGFRLPFQPCPLRARSNGKPGVLTVTRGPSAAVLSWVPALGVAYDGEDHGGVNAGQAR